MYASPFITAHSTEGYVQYYAGEFDIAYTEPEGLLVRTG